MSNNWQIDQNYRVLVVDDDKFVLQYMRQLLGRIGCCFIYQATDGEEAIEILLKNKIDLVFLDIKMAPINGLDALKSIRTGFHGLRRDIPVIFLTSANDDEVLGTALALDCNAFLSKPASIAEINEKMKRIQASPFYVKPSIAYQVINTKEVVKVKKLTETKRQVFIPPNATIISLDELSPGQVLAIDVCTLSGGVLLTANTMLTSQHIEKLNDIGFSTQIGRIAIKNASSRRITPDRQLNEAGIAYEAFKI